MTSEVIDRASQNFDSRSADQSGAIRRRETMTDVNVGCQPLYRSVEREIAGPPARHPRGELGQTMPDISTRLMSGDGHDGVDALDRRRAAALSGFPLQADRSAQRLRRSRSASPGASAPTASTARSRARISPSSGMDGSAASPDFSIRCRKAPDRRTRCARRAGAVRARSAVASPTATQACQTG